MNRNQARLLIGNKVVINEGKQGKYTATLLDVLTMPNTPWNGKIKITGVLSLPEFGTNSNPGINLKYNNEDEVIVPGKKIEHLSEAEDVNFNASLVTALKNKWEVLREKNDFYEKTMQLIQQELRKLNSEHVIFQDAFVYYQLTKKGRYLYIYDEQKRESLSLEGCPFEFEVDVNGQWKTAYYINNFTFETLDNRKVKLSHGDTVRLNKAQFDPYRILLNELEEPSLHALERGLEKLGIGHEHSVYCHNSLLIQLLSSFKQSYFEGVNFISYADETKQFVIQHHYERTMREDEPDKTFDRFEFTSDTGERVLTTYATEFSAD